MMVCVILTRAVWTGPISRRNRERDNLLVLRTILRPSDRYEVYFDWVPDHPGYCLRYAIDPSGLRCKPGWKPFGNDFEIGLTSMISWYRAKGSRWCVMLCAGRRTRRREWRCPGTAVAHRPNVGQGRLNCILLSTVFSTYERSAPSGTRFGIVLVL